MIEKPLVHFILVADHFGEKNKQKNRKEEKCDDVFIENYCHFDTSKILRRIKSMIVMSFLFLDNGNFFFFVLINQNAIMNV